MRRTLSLMLVLLLALTPCFAQAEKSVDEYIHEIKDSARVLKLSKFIKRAFDSEPDLIYEYNEEVGSYSLIFYSTDEKMGDLFTYVDAYTNGLLVTVCYETDAPQEAIGEIVRFVNMLNADMLGGKYYVFTDTGSICLEDFIDFGLVDLDALDEDMEDVFHSYLQSILRRANYDADYFAELISGETAENAYAIYLADQDE